jgi:tetratricopeptide (TPR) repeat protein
MKPFRFAVLWNLFLVVAGGSAMAQVPPKPTAAVAHAPAAKQALSMAEHGNCKEALPTLRRVTSRLVDKELKRNAGLTMVRCAMTLGRIDAALDALQLLNRDFPQDPEVLYVTTHAYSDLATRASLNLVQSAPASYQARELNAESLEMQGKWDEAAAEYRAILKQNPNLPGIHFRLGRFILSKAETPTTAEDAKKEFEEELKIDPHNAGAEYVLGELASRAQLWNDAIEHLSRSARIDPGFADASLALGMAYVATGKFEQAIAPLQTYVKQQPGNPAGHYQLAIAYNRVGRKQDATREAALQKQTAEALDADKRNAADAVQKESSGQEPPPSAPPN